MPTRKYKKKKTYKRKRTYTSLVSRGVPSGMPTIRRANLRYSEFVGLTSTLGNLNDYLFSANNIFDPNVTSVGHQPMGHDQWALLYNHYVVVGSKIHIKVIPNEATLAPAVIGTYLSDGVTLSYSTPQEYIEARKGHYRLLSPNSQRSVGLRNHFGAKKFFNVVDVKDNVKRIGGAINNHPSDQAYYHVWYATLDGTTASINFSVTIDYIVEYSEPKDLAKS